MKILYVINSLIGGGAEKLLNDILPLIKKDGVECVVLVLDLKNAVYYSSLTEHGITVFEIPEVFKRNTLKKIQYIYRFIEKGNYDIVHVNLFPALYYCSLIKRYKLKEKVFIYTEHNTDNRRRHHTLLRPIEKFMYKPYNSIISISEGTQDNLLTWLKVKKNKKYKIINNGIDLNIFLNSKPCDIKKISDKLNSEDKILCMIGSFTEQKNHELVIKIIKKLPCNYKLILLGEGPLKEKISNMIKKEELQDRVIVLGFRRDVASIIKASDVVVIPSRWEGFGLVAVEALACGKKVVCSNVAGLSEVVGNVGIKISGENADAYAEKIISIIDNGYDADECIEQALKFDINTMEKKYLNLYRECLMKG